MQKKFIVILIIILVILFGIAGWWLNKNQNNKTDLGINDLKNRVVSLSPDQEKVYFDRIKTANDYFKTLKPSTPNYQLEQIKTRMYLAQQYYGLGQLQESKNMYDLILKSEPKNEQALVGLSLIFIDAGKLEDAIKVLKVATESNPENTDTWLRYIALRQGMNVGEAEMRTIYENALSKTNRAVDILTKYAQFLEQAGKLEEAKNLWLEAAKIYPEKAGLFEQEAKRLQGLIKK